ncbi:MAG: hypothetical protein JNK89_08590, partial [Saprospiraceae bacterium]|nr:hypothetical protein [Saprospiraceae bacterium]
MKKNWCSALGLWLLFLPLLTAQNLPTFHAQPQANPSAPDLHGTLSAYKIYRLNADALQAFLQEENGDPEKRFALDLPGAGLWSLRLQPRQLLAADYRLQVDDGQAVQYLPGPGQITWAGYQGAGAQFRATLTVNAGFIFGSVQTPAGEFFIEPLYDLAPGAAPDLFIVYNTADVLPNPDLKCGVEEVRKKKAETQQPAPERLVGQCKHAEIAIASDYGMFTRYTNSTGVQNHNIGVMNSVATDYDDAFDDDIYFLITTQYVSSTSTSSLDVALTSTTDASILLDNFRVWGNAGNFGFDFDLATLWVTRNICSGSNCSTIGLAYVGALCDNFRYHLLEDYTGSNPNGTGWQLRVLTSHEIGHNFDCSHDPSGSNTIMAPSVNNTSTWSAQSEGEVAAYLPTITCLSLCGANFSSTSYAAGEGNGGLTLPAGPPSCEMPYVELAMPIQYSGPNTGGSVDVTVVGGTATEYLDFDLPSATVVFPAGFTTQTVNLIVRIWNDAISEGSETIELQLNGPSAGSQNMTTVTIVSDDANPTTSYYTFGQVGTGNAGGLNVPFRANNTDCRTQIILGASELSAAGFSANDIINGLALDVSSKSSTQPFNGFTIKMQHTTSGPTYTGQPANSGFTTVFSGNHTTSTG